MSAPNAVGFHQMKHDQDPRAALLAKVGAEIPTPIGAQVCIATYVRPDVTAGGIYRPDSHKAEDIYQGKVGLIIAMGPIAFQEDEKTKFGGVIPALHDWVLFPVGNTRSFDLNGTPCRMIDDVSIMGIVSRPDSIY